MRSVFINLVVRDAAAARAFWNSLGFPTNEQFTDATTSNAQLEENISVMLLERSKFSDFVKGPVADPSAGTAVLNCLSADSRDAVDALTDKALANGASEWMPHQDLGFMYGRSFQDPDGHVWEVLWMDPAVASGEAPPADMAATATA